MPSSKIENNTAGRTTKTPKAVIKIVNNEGQKSKEAPKKGGCCMGTAECQDTAQVRQTQTTATPDLFATSKGPKTKIVVKYDVGFNNLITIRGKGAGLSWERGLALKNIKADEWVWETDLPFTIGEFKVLINDKQYEIGDNHTLRCGSSVQYTPRF